MRFAARILFPTFFFLTAFLLLLKPAFAQTPPTNTNPDVPNNLHTWTQNVMIEVGSSLTCLIAGIDPLDPSHKCLGLDTKTGKIGYVDSGGGAIGVMGNLIAMTFTPPAHTSDYVKYLAGNFGLAKPAYAQGVGFAGISPLLPVWSAFRNIAYLVFVVVFVVIGFAIMLRVHIDPRTVMTVENQIPKLIVGLLLVTFSFAIAGFLIDLMWVLTYLIIGVFQNIASTIPNFPKDNVKQIIDNSKDIHGENALGVFNNLVGFKEIVLSGAGSITNILDKLLTTAFPSTSNSNIFGLITNIGAGFRNIVGMLIASLIGFLSLIIISIAVLYSLFRIWFTLIQAYVFIIIDVVFAPFWIMAGILPGANISFSSWLRDIASNLLAFPATIMMFLLANIFIHVPQSQGRLFVPPLIGNAGVSNEVQSLIGLGFILITPSIVTLIKAALKAPKLEGAGIGQTIGVGAGFPVNVGRGVGGIVMAGKEAIPNEHGIYEKRGLPRAFFGRTFRG